MNRATPYMTMTCCHAGHVVASGSTRWAGPHEPAEPEHSEAGRTHSGQHCTGSRHAGGAQAEEPLPSALAGDILLHGV